VTDVEDPDRLTYGRVLLEDSPAGVLQRHLPAAETGELRSEVQMPLVQG
jgi:hypothetical protein